MAKVNIYFLAFVFYRDFRRQERAKSKHIFGKWCECVVSCAPFVVCFIVSTWCRRCAPAPSLWVCSVPLPCLCPLSCFACRVACEYGFISRFKGVFSAFWGADVCLYRLRSLRGLWGFCVREWLGGFMACCVFALLFTSSPLFFFLFAYLLGLCLCCPWLVLLLVLFVLVCLLFPFPFRYMRKKKGRKVFLRPLLSCCGFV